MDGRGAGGRRKVVRMVASVGAIVDSKQVVRGWMFSKVVGL
jgi:hypothetical protein